MKLDHTDDGIPIKVKEGINTKYIIFKCERRLFPDGVCFHSQS